MRSIVDTVYHNLSIKFNYFNGKPVRIKKFGSGADKTFGKFNQISVVKI